MTIVVIVTVILCILAALLCLPATYDLTVYAGSPFSWHGAVAFGPKDLRQWRFTWGGHIETTGEGIGEIDESVAEGIAKAIEETDTGITYEDVKDSEKPVEEAKEPSFPWLKYVLNLSFIQACLSLLASLVHHSRIRQLTLDGALGLPQPHETGMIAGFLYSLVPASIGTLDFCYTDEIIAVTIKAKGRMYPAVVAAYALRFILCRPVRTLGLAWYRFRKDENHGK